MSKPQGEVVDKADPKASARIVSASRAELEGVFHDMLEAVPDAVDDDGFGIIAGLLEAEDWEGLNRESKLPDAVDQAGKQLKWTDVSKRPSDLGEGLPYYLIIDAVNVATGEAVKFQTSAPGVVIPAIKLQQWGKLPALCQIEKSAKPTKAGFYPLNVTVLAVG
jgi:hypothetical protein